MPLEKMDAFFAARCNGYDEHMYSTIEGASEFYPYTASLLPMEPDAEVLDLGCGTGLELEAYFRLNPSARVTGIDLSEQMLACLARKLSPYSLRLIRASYFEADLGTELYDAAVSVESLHHFPAESKLALYRNLFRALKAGGCFVLTDYFAASDEQEAEGFAELGALKKAQGICDDGLYHYDTPLTEAHEAGILREAGFGDVRVLRRWGQTSVFFCPQITVQASRPPRQNPSETHSKARRILRGTSAK